MQKLYQTKRNKLPPFGTSNQLVAVRWITGQARAAYFDVIDWHRQHSTTHEHKCPVCWRALQTGGGSLTRFERACHLIAPHTITSHQKQRQEALDHLQQLLPLHTIQRLQSLTWQRHDFSYLRQERDQAAALRHHQQKIQQKEEFLTTPSSSASQRPANIHRPRPCDHARGTAKVKGIALYSGVGIGAMGMSVAGIPFCCMIDASRGACEDMFKPLIDAEPSPPPLSVVRDTSLGDIRRYIDAVPLNAMIILHARLGRGAPDVSTGGRAGNKKANAALRYVSFDEWTTIIYYIIDRELNQDPTTTIVLVATPSCRTFSSANPKFVAVSKRAEDLDERRQQQIQTEQTKLRALLRWLTVLWQNHEQVFALLFENVPSSHVRSVFDATEFNKNVHYSIVKESLYGIASCERKRFIGATRNVHLDLMTQTVRAGTAAGDVMAPVTLRESLQLDTSDASSSAGTATHRFIEQTSWRVPTHRRVVSSSGTLLQPTKRRCLNEARGPTVMASSRLHLRVRASGDDPADRQVSVREALALLGWPDALISRWFPWVPEKGQELKRHSTDHWRHVGNGIGLGTAVSMACAVLKSMGRNISRDHVLQRLQEEMVR